MNNREQFEAFLVSEYAWANDALNAADFQGDDATGYYTGGDYIYDGQSYSEGLFWAWRGWQAASKASEQQLAAVVAECAGLKKFIQTDCFVGHIEPETFYEEEVTRYVSADGYEPETPATDRIYAGIKADGVEEFLKGSQLPYQIATVLADYDNADDETLHHVIWSGQPPEPDGDVWHLEYVSRGNAIAREVLKQLREGADK